MEVQERAHNASVLLSLVLRRLNAEDDLLPEESTLQSTAPLVDHFVDHDERYVKGFAIKTYVVLKHFVFVVILLYTVLIITKCIFRSLNIWV